ncbi:type II secretion system GspH family protein [bacterium]|nr:type II secretion system GspH family protein [bacterium]
MNKGFTLIEILIVVLILAVVALGIMALLPSGYQQITNAGRLSAINHLGYEKLDQLKALGYTNGDLIDGFHPTPNLIRLDSDPEFKGYSITWNVDDAEPFTGVKKVTVEVGYMLWELDGSDYLVSTKFQMQQRFVTYISR